MIQTYSVLLTFDNNSRRIIGPFDTGRQARDWIKAQDYYHVVTAEVIAGEEPK